MTVLIYLFRKYLWGDLHVSGSGQDTGDTVMGKQSRSPILWRLGPGIVTSRVPSMCWSHGRSPFQCCQPAGPRPSLSTCVNPCPIQHSQVYGQASHIVLTAAHTLHGTGSLPAPGLSVSLDCKVLQSWGSARDPHTVNTQ